ncbi:hypothetical protein BH10PSE12_BH10PSE12_25650 [soil metagenome]
MLRTLIFGTILGLVGKKLYDSGALNEFAADVKTRLDEAGLKVPTPTATPASATGATNASTFTPTV